jgi:hypothetical protein
MSLTKLAADHPGRPDLIQAVINSALRSPGESEPRVREAAFLGTAGPMLLSEYVRKIREASYKVIDADIAGLKDAAYSEDFIFELTIAAALGAATAQLDTALRVLRECEP